MKYSLIIITILFWSVITKAQSRAYLGCSYAKVEDHNIDSAKFIKEIVAIEWLFNDASNFDYIKHVEFPDGSLSQIGDMIYDGIDSNGYEDFHFSAVDESGKDVFCNLIKFNQRNFAINVSKSEHVDYLFYIDLFQFYMQYEID